MSVNVNVSHIYGQKNENYIDLLHLTLIDVFLRILCVYCNVVKSNEFYFHFSLSFHPFIDNNRSDKSLTHLLKDYVDKGAVKDFQIINGGACKPPFVQELLVKAAADLQLYVTVYFINRCLSFMFV